MEHRTAELGSIPVSVTAVALLNAGRVHCDLSLRKNNCVFLFLFYFIFFLIYSESFRAPHPSRGKTKSVIYFLRKMQSFVTTENHSSARWRNISGLDSRLSDQKMLNKMIKNCIGSRKKKYQKQKKTCSIKWGFN